MNSATLALVVAAVGIGAWAGSRWRHSHPTAGQAAVENLAGRTRRRGRRGRLPDQRRPAHHYPPPTPDTGLHPPAATGAVPDHVSLTAAHTPPADPSTPEGQPAMRMTIMSQNLQHRADRDRRWAGLVEAVTKVDPDLLMIQEGDWLTNPGLRRVAEADLGKPLLVAPSNHLPTAVAYNPDRLHLAGCDTQYTTDLHHGYCAPRFTIPALDQPVEVPLVAISTHLTPYSAQAAAQEAQLLGARAHRHGGLGIIAGDINHMPLGDCEPDWSHALPEHRMARCHRRTSLDEPWRADTTVGQVFRDGGFIDVAAHVADLITDPTLRAPTAPGGVRVDQIHVTAALAPTIVDYWTVPTHGHSDHDGIAAVLDLAHIDWSHTAERT